MTMVFREKRQFCSPKIVEKSQKNVIVTSTPDFETAEA
jgi:hypothetical protein